MQPYMIYITCKDKDEAHKVGKTIVRERLAACANILDGMQSIYWWQDNLETDNETVLILKTRAEKVEALIERVKAVHSYEVPCVVALPIEKGNPDYLAWLAAECP